MADAPERIWAWPFNVIWGGGYFRKDHRYPMDDTEREVGAEYIRADLVQSWQPIETAPKDVGRTKRLVLEALKRLADR